MEPKSKKTKAYREKKPLTRVVVATEAPPMEEPRSFEDRSVVAPLVVNDNFWSVELD